MRLLFIRHAEPDYEHDSLTEKGVAEAEALAAFAGRLDLGTCYVSPLGRAVKTASYTLAALGKTAETLDWLQEFPARIDVERHPEVLPAFPGSHLPDGTWRRHIVWDIMPAYYAAHPELADPVLWRTSDIAAKSNMLLVYDYVMEQFDALLAEHGYVREEGFYRVVRETSETLTFFCHFGISAVLLSRLMNISPFVPLHKLCMLPSSVTEVVTEEREPGTASFRALRIGDLSHLMIAGQEPSFAARFRETGSDTAHRA